MHFQCKNETNIISGVFFNDNMAEREGNPQVNILNQLFLIFHLINMYTFQQRQSMWNPYGFVPFNEMTQEQIRMNMNMSQMNPMMMNPMMMSQMMRGSGNQFSLKTYNTENNSYLRLWSSSVSTTAVNDDASNSKSTATCST